ncbi:AVEN regulator, partial [Nothoprocta pentlandii]|nr:AVEN regulator [Nothoprocta pentlandii]
EGGDDESREEEEKEDLKSYSRRKIVSNWSRYEDAERENDSAESQRGTDFNVLLSSAGKHSFAQFRFAEEKEWDTESLSHKQFSVLNVDCQILVQALQELPLHLRLNVAAELVQASTPAELPPIKFKTIEDSKRRETLFQQSKAAPGSHRGGRSAALPEPAGKAARAAEPLQRGCPLPQQDTDALDEELDRLLNLDAPSTVENSCVSRAVDSTITEKEQKMDYKEKEPQKLDVPEENSSASQQQQQQSASKNVTEEELEDWLDSMIS